MAEGIKSIFLFVVGNEPNSQRARANLARILDSDLGDVVDVQEFDVLKHFQEAIRHKVFVTPALIIAGESGTTTLYGDLSDHDQVLAAINGYSLKDA